MRVVPFALLVFACVARPAVGQDALRGKLLYNDGGRLNGAGVSCVDCHGGVPGALHGLGRVANNPAAIAYAIGAVGAMEPLRGRVTAQDMADIAAFVALPSVASPEPRVTTSGPAASPYSAERLEFAAAPAGSMPAASQVRLTNTGALPLRLLGEPEVTGSAVGEFAISVSDCRAGAILAAQQSCVVEVVFGPRGEPGLRTATLGLAFDWIRGGVHIALIGRVGSTPGTER